MGLEKLVAFWKAVVQEIRRVPLTRMAAALAFYGLFAVPPLLVATLLVAAEVFGGEQARDGLLDQVEAIGGEHGRQTAADMIRNMPRPGAGELVTQVISVVVFFFAATTGFTHLQRCLNQIAEAKPRRRRIQVLLDSAKRLFGFAFVVVLSLVLLGIATMGVAFHVSPDAWISKFPEVLHPFFTALVQYGGFFGIAFLGLTIVYRVLPDVRVAWRSAFVGAFTASLLLLAVQGGLALYLGHSWRNVAFGAAGSVVGLLISFYAASIVVLFGAIVAKVYTERRLRPAAGAVT